MSNKCVNVSTIKCTCRGRLAGDPGGFEPPLWFERGFIFWNSAILELCIHLDYTHEAAQCILFT